MPSYEDQGVETGLEPHTPPTPFSSWDSESVLPSLLKAFLSCGLTPEWALEGRDQEREQVTRLGSRSDCLT